MRAWLQARDDIDGERIAVYGGSYGGFMVLSALTAYPELWAAGVDIVGISKLVAYPAIVAFLDRHLSK